MRLTLSSSSATHRRVRCRQQVAQCIFISIIACTQAALGPRVSAFTIPSCCYAGLDEAGAGVRIVAPALLDEAVGKRDIRVDVSE